MQNTSKRPLGQRLITAGHNTQQLCVAALLDRDHIICTTGGAGQEMPNTHLTLPKKQNKTNLKRFSAQQNRNRNGIKYRTMHLLPTLLTMSKAPLFREKTKKKKSHVQHKGHISFYPEPAEPASQPPSATSLVLQSISKLRASLYML